MNKYFLLFLVLPAIFTSPLNAQMSYEYANNKTLTAGSYGRIGIDWSFENDGSVGRIISNFSRPSSSCLLERKTARGL